MNCLYCGKVTQQKYCSVECEDKEKQMFNLSDTLPLVFDSHSKAAEFYGRDRRTINKYQGSLYIIDKERVSSLGRIYSKCLACDNLTLSSKARHGYCKECTKKGVGKKQQGKTISKLFKGPGNPNYVNGKSKNNFRSKNSKEYRAWRKAVLKGREGHTHHILPFALFPQYKFEIWNGLVLTEYQHIELHRRQLDVVLLPIVYNHLESLKKDVQDLPEWYSHLPEVQSILQLPEKQFPEHELLRVVPSNYRKLVQHHHPEFAQQVFPHWE